MVNQKKSPAKKATSAAQWKSKHITELTVPSGNVALVKLMGPDIFLKGGSIPNVLLPYVQESINSKKGMKPGKAEEIMKDPEQIKAALDMLNFILTEAIVEPKVLPVPEPIPVKDKDGNIPERDPSLTYEDQRDPEALYADDVEMMDKVFIANFVMGGTKDLKSFREQYQAIVGPLAAFEDVSG